jgi:3-hydroxyacyl-CoA dehydrogenase
MYTSRLLVSAPRLSLSATAAGRIAATARHLSTTPQLNDAATSGQKPKDVKNICLFGAGLMGAGIAQVAAHHGFKVVLCDTTEKALDNGRGIIQKSIARVAKKSYPEDEQAQKDLVTAVFSNITTTTNPVEAVQNADLVVEAIVENLNIKRELFALLDKNASQDCIFASNTSSLSITEIASSTSNARRKQFGGLHFFNPVPQMKLVEVIRTNETSDATFATLIDVCKRMKKTTVCCKDTPGFIVNRLLVPYLIEAIRMVERGDATAEDIDIAMKLGAGYPMGPVELTDFVGLDTSMHIIDGWRKKVVSGEEKSLTLDMVKESPLLKQKVADGKTGRKAGEGFFKYTK